MTSKEQLASQITKILAFSIQDQVTLNMCMDSIIIAMDSYDVSQKSTAIVPYETASEQQLQLFAATLLTEGKSKGTIKTYMCGCKKALLGIGKPFSEMTAFDIRVWLAKLQQTTSLRTCENYRSYLSSFFHWLYVEDLIEKNPMDKVKPIKFVKTVKTAFSDIDVDKLRSSCNDTRNRAILELMLSSGLRVEEVSDLRMDDIDMNTLTVLVRDGKGGKARTSYISPLAREYIKSYLRTRADLSPALFYSRSDGNLSTSQIEKICKQLGAAAGVDNVHPHRFRRTFATNLYKRGMDIHSIQILMGHVNINTTMGYISIDATRTKAEYEKYA